MSSDSEKWSDNTDGLMVGTVKCPIWGSTLGLVWGLMEMVDRQRKIKEKGGRGVGGLMELSVLHSGSGSQGDMILLWQTAQSGGKGKSSAKNRQVWVSARLSHTLAVVQLGQTTTSSSLSFQ